MISSKRNTTALHEACFHGHYDCAEILIKRGAYVNARDTVRLFSPSSITDIAKKYPSTFCLCYESCEDRSFAFRFLFEDISQHGDCSFSAIPLLMTLVSSAASRNDYCIVSKKSDYSSHRRISGSYYSTHSSPCLQHFQKYRYHWLNFVSCVNCDNLKSFHIKKLFEMNDVLRYVTEYM